MPAHWYRMSHYTWQSQKSAAMTTMQGVVFKIAVGTETLPWRVGTPQPTALAGNYSRPVGWEDALPKLNLRTGMPWSTTVRPCAVFMRCSLGVLTERNEVKSSGLSQTFLRLTKDIPHHPKAYFR